MLTKLESNWFYLENQLSNYIQANCPNQMINFKKWQYHINQLPVTERTLHLSSIINVLSVDNSNHFLRELNMHDELTIKAFERSIVSFKKRGEVN